MALALWPAPSRAGNSLPDRNTPTPASADRDRDRGGGPAGAHIELQADTLPATGWSVVEWQDANGDWQLVEGWQATLTGAAIRWWVHPKDFGTGPFRWAILDAPGGKLIAASEPFTLPRFPNETLPVSASPAK
ncbi:MAG: hypothetical protein Kow0031_34420 [Anaerolineae bacterium]